MKIALADLPWPYLAETRVVAQAGSGNWHDLQTVTAELGLPDAARVTDLPATLAVLSSLNAGAKRKIENALLARQNGTPSPKLLKPIDPLAKILLTEGRIALSRSNDQLPAKMVVGFSKFATALADPDAEIRLPDPQARYDAEATLAVVLGKPATRVTAGAASRSIIGFTLMAEITHRDMFDAEWRTSNSLFAKNCLDLSPLGPCIWVANLAELDATTEITLAVNGSLRQRFAVSDFAHSIANATKAWSRCVLEPGDMVALGAAIATPRPGAEIDTPIPIVAGDRLEVSCAPIGALTARFVA
jgi:2-keto-4-pentenoate hydratase/2-oxohepta-3-ene-1,7-dioic acid hydratase in catechol pathway